MNKNDKKEIIIISIFVLAGLIAMMYITNLCTLNVDEKFTLNLIQNDFLTIISLTGNDVHPPLYYFILKTICEFAMFFKLDLIVVCRFVSIVPHIILIIIAFTFIKSEFGVRASCFFAFCFIYMPKMLTFSIQIRMYSWSMLFVMCTLIYAYLIMKYNRGRDWIGIVLFTLCAAYTHYFACVTVAIILLCLGILFLYQKEYSKFKRWIISGIISLVLYLPWMIILFNQIFDKGHLEKHTAWIPKITPKQIVGFYSFFTTPSYLDGIDSIICLLMTCVFVIVYMNVIGELINKKVNLYNVIILIGIIALAGQIIVGITTSVLLRPVFSARYIMCAVGTFWFSLSVSIGRYIKGKKLGFVYITLIFCGILNFYLQFITLIK